MPERLEFALCAAVTFMTSKSMVDTSVHMHVRIMLMIWEVLAVHFVNDAGLLDLRSRGLNTAKVVSCCVIDLHRAMG